jgi:hypothetical protein
MTLAASRRKRSKAIPNLETVRLARRPPACLLLSVVVSHPTALHPEFAFLADLHSASNQASRTVSLQASLLTFARAACVPPRWPTRLQNCPTKATPVAPLPLPQSVYQNRKGGGPTLQRNSPALSPLASRINPATRLLPFSQPPYARPITPPAQDIASPTSSACHPRELQTSFSVPAQSAAISQSWLRNRSRFERLSIYPPPFPSPLQLPCMHELGSGRLDGHRQRDHLSSG